RGARGRDERLVAGQWPVPGRGPWAPRPGTRRPPQHSARGTAKHSSGGSVAGGKRRAVSGAIHATLQPIRAEIVEPRRGRAGVGPADRAVARLGLRTDAPRQRKTRALLARVDARGVPAGRAVP